MSFIRTIILFIAFCFSISCINTTGIKEAELNIGAPQQKFKMDLSDLRSYINTKLLTDSSRNLIIQLGKYKFSTSIDAANAVENRYNPDVFIYYDYAGLQLKYVFKGAGLLKRSELQKNLEQYKQYIYLESIIVEPKVYKGSLPNKLSPYAKASDVEITFGKHNSHFDEGGTTRKINYTYPEHGLRFLFNFYLGDISPDSTIKYLTLSDSVTEMKRYPTIYPHIK